MAATGRWIDLLDPTPDELAAHLPEGARESTAAIWEQHADRPVRPTLRGAGDHVDAAYSYVELEGVSHWVPEQAAEALAAAVIDRVVSYEP